MCTAVGDALFRVVSDHGVDPDYDTLAGRYRSVAERFVDQYAVDAAYNELDYDPSDERDQITAYSETISQPGVDTRLPAWCETTLSPVAVAKAAAADLAAATAESNTMSPESAETVDDLH